MLHSHCSSREALQAAPAPAPHATPHCSSQTCPAQQLISLLPRCAACRPCWASTSPLSTRHPALSLPSCEMCEEPSAHQHAASGPCLLPPPAPASSRLMRNILEHNQMPLEPQSCPALSNFPSCHSLAHSVHPPAVDCCKLCICYVVRPVPLPQCWSEGSKRRGMLKGRGASLQSVLLRRAANCIRLPDATGARRGAGG